VTIILIIEIKIFFNNYFDCLQNQKEKGKKKKEKRKTSSLEIGMGPATLSS